MPATRPTDDAVARIAAAIGEPARARILFCLMANRARTGTELAAVAGVSPATASVHLRRLEADGLVRVAVQGKHRYYSLAGANVTKVLSGLSALAGGAPDTFVPSTPEFLRNARTCYDHIAGTLGVGLHDRLVALRWIAREPGTEDARANGAGAPPDAYTLTPRGAESLAALGVDVDGLRATRRRFAFACLDWSERRSHIGGAVGAALLELAERKRWIAREPDSRALRVTASGRREFSARFGLDV